MAERHFFGYGSLVNRGTYEPAGVFPARLGGWRRAWRATPDRARCYLTAVPAPGAEIWGVVVSVPAAAQQALDRREQAYQRVDITADLRAVANHPCDHVGKVEIHTIPAGRHFEPSRENPVLLSYLDTVVQGYLQEFGEAGIDHFFATTTGWQAPFIDDRAAPLYPRARMLGKAEKALVDAGLARLGVRVLPG